MALQDTHDALVPQPVPNDGFFPDLELSEFQELFRLPAAVAPKTIENQLLLALAETNGELAAWKADREADTEFSVLDDTQELYYREAVFSRAYGLLIPMLVTLFFTGQGDGLEDDLLQNEERFYARGELYINRLKRTEDATVAATAGEMSADAL